MNEIIIEVKKISKVYDEMTDNPVISLNNISMSIEKGEFICVMGTSGSGKTTFINCISTMDTPSKGQVILYGKSTLEMSDEEIGNFRSKEIGFIFQEYNLLSVLNAYDNIALPFTLDRVKKVDHEYIKRVMKSLKIWDKRNSYPSELSGGQRQRVAIARALAIKPMVILADEPTGNLDSKTAMDVMLLLKQCNKEFNQTFLVITHDEKIAQMGCRTIHICDGNVYKL